MQLIPSTTALAATAVLLAGQAIAECGYGLINRGSSWRVDKHCILNPDNIYDCNGNILFHQGVHLTLTTEKGAATVYVACGKRSFLLHCGAQELFTFDIPLCADHVDTVQTVVELP
ncbi:hypothetical protein E4U41_005011 [Claviceps citrina]|nr:hypothetical protein E4U41_005011 [Claviceps citrina]